MARPRKMITEKDISKNSSIKISGTINRIKANEKKYTCYLVVIFMFLFMIIGYFTLRINKKNADEYLKNDSLTLKSELVTLSEEKILNDQDGLNSKDYKITLYNGAAEDVRYRVLLVKDETLTDLCECRNKEIKASDLRLSFAEDIVTYNNFEDIVIDTGKMQANESKTVKVKIWLSENADAHFHGRFILERVD